mgnify:CR=1 FL=1
MHPRNRYYRNPADFGKLGEIYAEFRQYLLPTSGGSTINFKDPKALRQLTISLLHHDFGLNVKLPLDRLIPTVTLRLNYIHWIEDLLQMLPADVCQITGIDVGTGASCIYPLLGAKINGWKFRASEVDEMSYRFAGENVKRNDLGGNIEVYLVTPDVVLADLLREGEDYHFTMCNPPFFADKSEMVENRSGNRPQPSSVCTGTESETVTSGGEVAFVGRMIDDSLKLGSRIKWYTTMLGKKSSLTSVMAKLKENGISNMVTTEFCQGRTTRWGVAWTFLSQVTTEWRTPKKKRKSKLLQFPISAKKVCPNASVSKTTNVDLLISRISERFKELLDELQIEVISESSTTTEKAKRIKLHCNASRHTWGDQRRKRREAAGKLRSSKQPSTSHNSAVASENFQTENISMKGCQTVLTSELDQAESTEADQNINAVNDTPQIENLHSKSRIVTDLNCVSDTVEAQTTTNIKHSATPKYRTQNNETQKFDTKLQADTEHKTVSLYYNDRKRKEAISPDSGTPKQKLLKEDDHFKSELKEQFFLAFVLLLEARYDDISMLSQIFLQMEWINGSNRNCMYQLFQYFQNLFSS